MNEYDVIIVGAGPAGSSCALFCAKKGLKVLLLDKAKFPRDKTCGDGISGKSLRLLNELGIVPAIESKEHAKMSGVLFSAPNGTNFEIELKENGKPKTVGYCIRREVFDNTLLEAAKKVATVIESFKVNELIWENGFVVGVKGTSLVEKKDTEFRTNVVVGADGFLSVVAKQVNSVADDDNHSCIALRAYFEGVEGLTDKIELHFVDEVLPGYFWIFPIGNASEKRANVGIGMLSSEMKKRRVNLRQVLLNAIQKNETFKKRFANAKLTSPILGWNLLLGSKRRKNNGNGWLLIGDSAALIDPFTGEGIGNSLLSGKLAAETIENALKKNDFSEKKLGSYETLLSKSLDHELRRGYWIQKLSNSKFLLNYVFSKARKSEELREMLVSTLIRENEGKKHSKWELIWKLLAS